MKFRNYCEDLRKIATLTESKKFMAQHSTRQGDQTPIPGPADMDNDMDMEKSFPKDLKVSVSNVLNMVDPRFQKHVLRWIFNTGVRRASVARKKLAMWAKERVKEKFGVELPLNFTQWQAAMFNPDAYNEFKELKAIAPEIEQQWFKNSSNEPDAISLPDVKRHYSLSDINAMLIRDGKRPLMFGGENGLLSYLEKGSWATDKIHRDPEFGNQGHDLSLPTDDYSGEVLDPVSGRRATNLGTAKSTALDFGDQNSALRQGGYTPPTNPDYWQKQIDQAKRQSRTMLDKIINDLLAGKKFDDPDMQFLNQLVKDGKINPEFIHDKQDLLSAVVGLKNKEAKGDLGGDEEMLGDRKGGTRRIMAGGSDQDYVNAKAAVKAWLDQSLQTPVNPNIEGHMKQLGVDNNNEYPFASIRGEAGKRLDLNPDYYDLSDPIVRDEVSNKLLDMIFDDKTRSILTYLSVVRNGEGSTRKWPKKIGKQRIPISDMMATRTKTSPADLHQLEQEGWKKVGGDGKTSLVLSNGKDTKNLKADKTGWKEVSPSFVQKSISNAANQGKPISITVDGQKVDVDPTTLNEKLTKSTQRIYKGKGYLARPLDSVEGSEVTPQQIKDLESKGYKVVGGNGETKLILHQPGSQHYRRFVRDNENSNWNELRAGDRQHIALKAIKKYLNPPHNNIAIGVDDAGVEHLVKKQDGTDNWFKIPDPIEADIDNPILTGIKPVINTGKGIRNKTTFDKAREAEEWDEFMSNLEDYGDRPTEFEGQIYPQSVRFGATSVKAKGYSPQENIGAALEGVRSEIADMSFRYGTPKILSHLLSEKHPEMSPEETQDLLSKYTQVIFKNRGKVAPYDGSPQVVKGKTLYVNQDLMDLILHAGYLWRANKARSWARNSFKKMYDARQVGKGVGGASDSDEDLDYTKSIADTGDEEDAFDDYANDMGDDNLDFLQRQLDGEELGTTYSGNFSDEEPDEADRWLNQLKAANPKGTRMNVSGAYAVPDSEDSYISPTYSSPDNDFDDFDVSDKKPVQPPVKLNQSPQSVQAQADVDNDFGDFETPTPPVQPKIKPSLNPTLRQHFKFGEAVSLTGYKQWLDERIDI